MYPISGEGRGEGWWCIQFAQGFHPSSRETHQMPSEKELLQITAQLARLTERCDQTASDLRENYSALQSQIEDHTTRINDGLTRLEHLLLGNGSDGLVVRIDRLEQNEDRRSKLTWAAVGSSIACAIGLVFKIFFRG